MMMIFKGDDTGGRFGRVLSFVVSAAAGTDLTGCTAVFIFDGIEKRFSPVTHGQVVAVNYSRAETDAMPLGIRFATFLLIDADGRTRTFDNTIPVRVTDDVAAAYPGAAQVTIAVGENVYRFLRIVDTKPASPRLGDCVLATMEIYNGSAWVALGGGAGGSTVTATAVTGGTKLTIKNGTDTKNVTVPSTAAGVGAIANTGNATVERGWNLSVGGESTDIIKYDDASSQWKFGGAASSADTATSANNAYYLRDIPPGGPISEIDADVTTDDDGKERVRVSSVGEGGEEATVGYCAYVDEVNDAARYDKVQPTESYPSFASNSVSYLVLDDSTDAVTIKPPAKVAGKVRDFIVYVFSANDKAVYYNRAPEMGETAAYFAPDGQDVKTVKANTLTALCFSEIATTTQHAGGVFAVSKVEFAEVTDGE